MNSPQDQGGTARFQPGVGCIGTTISASAAGGVPQESLGDRAGFHTGGAGIKVLTHAAGPKATARCTGDVGLMGTQ
jgi:hypothetical protein